MLQKSLRPEGLSYSRCLTEVLYRYYTLIIMSRLRRIAESDRIFFLRGARRNAIAVAHSFKGEAFLVGGLVPASKEKPQA